MAQTLLASTHVTLVDNPVLENPFNRIATYGSNNDDSNSWTQSLVPRT